MIYFHFRYLSTKNNNIVQKDSVSRNQLEIDEMKFD